MPRYSYICDDCTASAKEKLGRDPTENELCILVFEVSHSILSTAEEVLKVARCPHCEGHNTHITLLETSQSFRIRGGNWYDFRKKNAAALQRDMALHQLEHDDPYGYMRPPGEKVDLADKIRASAKKQTQKKYFLT